MVGISLPEGSFLIVGEPRLTVGSVDGGLSEITFSFDTRAGCLRHFVINGS